MFVWKFFIFCRQKIENIFESNRIYFGNLVLSNATFSLHYNKKKPWSSIDFLLIGSSWQVGVERGGGCGAWEGRRGTCKHRATASPAVTWRARRGRITFKGEKKNKEKTWNKFSTPNRFFYFFLFLFYY